MPRKYIVFISFMLSIVCVCVCLCLLACVYCVGFGVDFGRSVFSSSSSFRLLLHYLFFILWKDERRTWVFYSFLSHYIYTCMSISCYISQNWLYFNGFYLLSLLLSLSLSAVWLDSYCNFVHCIFAIQFLFLELFLTRPFTHTRAHDWF